MAKFTVTIESRHLYTGPEERSVSELWDLNIGCHFTDDGETERDFDVTLYSDAERFTANAAYDESETVISDQASAAVTGTRTNATVFTRTAGSWTVDQLIGYYGYFYAAATPDSGSWLRITDNAASTVTISGTIPAGADSVRVSARNRFRHNVQIVPQEGLFGSFYKYKIEKKVPADGNFKFMGATLRAIPKPGIDPEFLAGLGSNSNGWSE
jgi:hypothetical protein